MRYVLFISAVLLFQKIIVCDTLTLKQAVAAGLKNNWSIRIAENESIQADNTRKLKAGHILPSVNADASAQYSETDYAGSFSSSPTGSVPGYSAGGSQSSYSTGLKMSWTLFDGFAMFHGFRQVEDRARLSETSSRRKIESSVVEIVTAYQSLVSSGSLLEAAEKLLEISRKRLMYAESRHEHGRADSRELLNAEVSFNSDSSAVAARKVEELTALQSLNIAMGREPDIKITLAGDSPLPVPEHEAQYWYEKAEKHNAGLSAARIQKNIAASQAGIARASFWPVIKASGSYTGVWGDNEYTSSSVGVSASLPLFSGLSRLTSVQNAKIDERNAELSLEKTKKELKAHIYRQWERYVNAWQQVSFEKKAAGLAEKSLELSSEQYRAGRISDIQFRDSQLALLNAQTRLESARFQCRVISVQLRQLAGEIRF